MLHNCRIMRRGVCACCSHKFYLTCRRDIIGLILVKELAMVNFEEGLSVKDFKTRPLPMLRADTAMYAAKLILCCVNLVDASCPAHNQMTEQRIPCGCFNTLSVMEGLHMHLSRILVCSIRSEASHLTPSQVVIAGPHLQASDTAAYSGVHCSCACLHAGMTC